MEELTTERHAVKRGFQELKNLGIAVAPKDDQEQREGQSNENDRVSSAIACYLIDKFDTEIEEMLPDLACKAQDSHQGGKVDCKNMDPSDRKSVV